jgi:hypothetical protein
VERVLEGGLEFAVITARWNSYVGLAPGRSAASIRMLGMPGATTPADDQYAVLTDRLRETIRRLSTAGVHRVLVIGPVPEFELNPYTCVVRAASQGRSWDVCTMPRDAVETRRVRTVAALNEAISGWRNVRLIDPIDVFCDRSVCRPYEEDTVLYTDEHHLSTAGAERLHRAFEAEFNWVAADNRIATPF